MSASEARSREPPSPTTGTDLLEAFENGSLDPARFSHRSHLAVAWGYLQRDGFPEGAVKFRERLREYVAAAGAAAKYHETITWAYLFLLNEERCLRSAPGESFESMIERRPDLLDHRNGAIARRYPRSQLEQADARRVFLLPYGSATSPT
jgi:hypothetical protein